ncbi:MAG: hypothetical protein GX094_00550 [Clostridiales bacterium]|jgi:hypothetical protein|nr:hypothetical protein [Clostridiales bacterium]
MKNLSKYFAEGVSALLPVYVKGVGDSTLLITSDGEKRMIHRKLKTVIKRLVSQYSYDVVSLHKKYGELISQKYKIPLPLHPNLILIPFKTRKPRIQGDYTYGYVNYKCINKYLPTDKHSRIVLDNGFEIPLLQSYYTTRKNILNAAIIAKEFIRQYYGMQELKVDLQSINDDFNSPATRSDIAMLNYSMGKLLQIIESLLSK